MPGLWKKLLEAAPARGKGLSAGLLPMDQNVRDRISILNFLFMLDVLLYHIGVTDSALAMGSADSFWYYFDANIVKWMSGLCMSFFFGVTGFLLFYRLDFGNLGGKLRKRAVSLLVPYLLWQGIYLLKAFLQGQPWTLQEIVRKVFLMEMWPPVGALWYLYAVFLLALLSPVLLLLFRNRRVGFAAVLVLLVGIEFLYHRPMSGGSYVGNLLMHLPAYLFGAYLGHFCNEMEDRDRFLFFVTVVFFGMFLETVFPDLSIGMLMETVPLALIWLFPVKEWMKNRSVYKLSFLMLATHQSVISLVVYRTQTLAWRIIPSAVLSTLAGQIVGIAACIAVAALIHAVMQRFTPKTLKLLTGGRC